MEALKREGFIPAGDDDEGSSRPVATDVRGYVEVVGERDKRLVYRHGGDTLDLSDLRPDEAVERIRRTMLQPA
jgi:hypothetical protein